MMKNIKVREIDMVAPIMGEYLKSGAFSEDLPKNNLCKIDNCDAYEFQMYECVSERQRKLDDEVKKCGYISVIYWAIKDKGKIIGKINRSEYNTSSPFAFELCGLDFKENE